MYEIKPQSCIFVHRPKQLNRWVGNKHKGNHEYYVILLQLKEVDSLSFFKDVKENRTKSAIFGVPMISYQKYIQSLNLRKLMKDLFFSTHAFNIGLVFCTIY